MMNLYTPITTPVINLADHFNPVKTGKGDNHSIFILDDSGSMFSSRKATISGFNEYLNNQRRDAKKSKKKTLVSLYKFDGSNVTCVINRKNIKKVAKLTEDDYYPRGLTNLYDAIGSVMSTLNDSMSKVSKKDRDAVIITILTDGHENASRTFSSTSIKHMVEKAEGKNWGFMFLGANIDAFAAGSVLGFTVDNTMQYDMKNIKKSINNASMMTTRLRGAINEGISTTVAYASTGFTDKEREEALKDG